MHISWLGQTCVKLQTKYLDQDVTVLLDAYKPAHGEFPRSFTPTIAMFSNGMEGAATLSQDPLVINTLGEFEMNEVMVTAWEGDGANIIYKINAEGLSIVHLGKMLKKVDPANLEKIGHIDILLIPAGNGASYLPLEDAVDLVTALEPRIVIPIAYQCDTEKTAKPVSDFVKELGIKPEVTDKKLIIKKKDLPQEETKLYILEKNV